MHDGVFVDDVIGVSKKFTMEKYALQLGLLFTAAMASAAIAQRPLQVQSGRWLEISQLKGTVSYYRGSASRFAKVGMRLQAIGEGIQTSARSRAALSVDTGIGTIEITENTNVQVQRLQTLPNGGHVTYLTVTKGQVRLQVRRFTNPSSELRLQTPAGWSGVRGTEFGIAVHPDGKTGVATGSGRVVAFAENQTVSIPGGYQSLIIPGEPPTPPKPIPREQDARLQLQMLIAIDQGRNVRISGQINPVNLLTLAAQPQIVSRDGQFEVVLPLPADRRISAVVTTPLGTRQLYELAVP